MLGQLDGAMACLEEATRIYRARGDLAGVARCLHQRAQIDEREGAFEDACNGYLEAAELHEITGNKPARARAIANSGIQQWLMGDLSQAEATIGRAQAMFLELGLARDVLLTQGNLAGICMDRGDTTGARTWFQTMLEGAQAAGDQRQVAYAMLGLCGSIIRLGNAPEARRLLDNLASQMAAAVLQELRPWMLGLQASLAAMAGEVTSAVALATQALALSRTAADVPEIAAAERALGHWHHLAGNLDAAMQHTLNAMELLERPRTTRGVGFMHAIAQMAVLENERHGSAGARPLAQQAVALAQELQLGENYGEPELRSTLQQAIALAR